MAENNVPPMAAEQDNMLSTAIMDFLQREREELAQQEQQQQLPDPTPQATPEPQPEAQKPQFCIFFTETLEVEIPEAQALPSTIARYFGIKKSELQLKKKNKTYTVHESEDKFVPLVKTKGRYEVVTVAAKQASNAFHDCVEEFDGCTIILNDQQASIPGGIVTKAQIATALGIKRTDFRLIGQDGTIISHKNQFTLNPGAVYHVIHPGQTILKSVETQADKIPKELSFSRPMSYMAPYFISVLRMLYTLSFTEDAITFNDDVIEETKTSTLLCSNTLSTCAYQVAFGFNELAKAIQNVTTKIAQNSYKKSYDYSAATQKYEVVSNDDGSDNEESEEEHHQFYEDTETSDSPLTDMAKIVELFQKTIIELEDLSQLVMKQMHAKNPTVDTVKTSLQIRADEDKRKIQRKKFSKIEPQELQKICKNIGDSDEQICPTSADLYAVTSNRNQLNHGEELVDKILEDYDKDCVYADVAKLLNYCAQVSHCTLMHWMFAYELLKTMEYDEKSVAAGKAVENEKFKKFAAFKLYQCLRIWNTVSLAVPFYINLDENVDESVFVIWKNMKDKVIASQYALEIYNATTAKDKKNKKSGGTM